MLGVFGAIAGVAFAEFTAARAQVCYARKVVTGSSPSEAFKRLALDSAGSQGIVLPEFGNVYKPVAAGGVAALVVGIGFAL